MKGDPAIIEALNDLLTAELTAINQYFIHHKLCENWGYARLSSKKREESTYEGGKKHGRSTYWRTDGSVDPLRSGTFEAGERIGD